MPSTASPTFKLFLAGLIAVLLVIPLLMVYGLISDRQAQARVAQDSIVEGMGGPQTVTGPMLMVPYVRTEQISETIDGQFVTRQARTRDALYLHPVRQRTATTLSPERKRIGIYENVVYAAKVEGTARFEFPSDLARYGTTRESLLLDEAQLRFGVADMRGFRTPAEVRAGGRPIMLEPGQGSGATGGSGFHGFVEWNGQAPLDVSYAYALNGSRAFSFVPRGGQSDWTVRSSWAHPGFAGAFLPDARTVGDDGFEAEWSVGNLALGQSVVSRTDMGPIAGSDAMPPPAREVAMGEAPEAPASLAATITLIDPADVYSKVDRAVKYGFLFIGFTFLAYLMFDLIGRAQVATAEYMLTGVGLVLFFVLLLAFAEVVPFALAYVLASGAIIGLLTAYSAAVLASWRRAWFMGGLLVALYATLYILLSLEQFALLVGALLLFAALAATMYATRRIDWIEWQREQVEE